MKKRSNYLGFKERLVVYLVLGIGAVVMLVLSRYIVQVYQFIMRWL